MVLLLASLGMGLAAIIVAFFVMQAEAAAWPPPGTPPLPVGLWLSTGLIVASSGTMHAAVRAVRRNRIKPARWFVLATLLLGGAFLASQIMNWGLAYAANMPPALNMFSVLFYLFTGLHGLHILGGLVPLGIVTWRSFRGRYTPQQHNGLRFCALYWHFVDVAWVVMFAVLLLGGGLAGGAAPAG